MPELPDILLYQEKLRERLVSMALIDTEVPSPSLLRTVEPALESLHGRPVLDIGRAGKRLVLEFDGDYFAVIHLMIAGRFRWLKADAKGLGKITAALFRFSNGTLALTEAGKKKRASLHIVAGRAALGQHEPAGLDVLGCGLEDFHAALVREQRSLKRALTNPQTFSGIGNAYSDEILHAARLSPFRMTGKLSDGEVERLFSATMGVLRHWIDVMQDRFRNKFPGARDITAFREDFAVHGRFGHPCPVCRTKVERVRFAENELNYCPQCQTQGRVLSDRSLSRLLK